MPGFNKPSHKPREEPKGLDAFAAGVKTTPIVLVKEAPPASGSDKSKDDLKPMNVRFTKEHKEALQLIAEHEKRSQNFIIQELLGPILLERARQIRGE